MNTRPNTPSRRRFLELAGSAAVMIPLVNLTGCGAEEPNTLTEDREAGGGTPEPGTRPTDTGQGQPGVAMEQSGQAPAQSAQPAPADPQPAGQPAAGGQAQGAGSLVRLEESNPQAQALGYVHDASQVDKSAYPRYEQGQRCSNCNLYQPDQGEPPWGGCQLFPGKLVNAEGWCSAWVAAPQT